MVSALNQGDNFFVRTRRRDDEVLNLRFEATQTTHVTSGGDVVRYNLRLGAHSKKTGAGTLVVRLGVNECGEENPHAMFIVSVAAGINWRGGELVRLAEELGRWLGVTELYLTDAAIVGCPSAEIYDLSLFVLMKHGVTWYMRLGFDMVVNPSVRCATRKIEKRHRKALNRAVKMMRELSLAEVAEDARAIVGAVSGTSAEKVFEELSFDELDVWHRAKLVRPEDPLYATDKLKAFVGVHRNLGIFLEKLPKNLNVNFVDWIVSLQKKDCSKFHEIYTALFDNEIYYWRSRRCMYHIGKKTQRLKFRLAACLQIMSAVLDPVESGEMWFSKKI